MKKPIIRGMDLQDTVAAEAGRISQAMNEVARDRIMIAQQVQGMTPDQASMCCVVAHAFSLQRLLNFPGLDPNVRTMLTTLASTLMVQREQHLHS